MSKQDVKRLEAKDRKKGEQSEDHQKKKVEKPKDRLMMTRNVIRFGETNVDGSYKVYRALKSVRGVSFAFANAVSSVSGMGNKVIGELSESDLAKLDDMISHPEKHGIPLWMYNRRKDPETGKDMHITVSQLEFTHGVDINRMKRIKSYKGVRHMFGLPVRGQRTRSSFRKGTVVGVVRKKAMPGAPPQEKGKK